ncbi:MAG: Do family serine endopeptidase AlgW [Gammaproteobacteria bacterium]|nr:MAG: Do family serine endopeptidase AlgW [Gammaproteobacteria bacterium]
MPIRKILLFVFQATIFGLAVAFLLSVIWPDILNPGRNTPTAKGPYSYADAVTRAAPAVVNINTAKLEKLPEHPFLQDPIFRGFFKDRPRKRVKARLGSGVIFRQDGYIITNHHVIKDAQRIRVYLRDGRTVLAKVIGQDTESDLAVLKIPLDKLPTIPLLHNRNTRVGDVVLAIGNPYGFGHTVTQGIVSATGRNRLGINTFENFIQTDAAINPGNSGGALVDARGNLVGINTAIFSQDNGNTSGIGFAIPVDLVTQVFESIVRDGRVIRGWLGINAAPLNSTLARHLRLKNRSGIVVVSVVANSPAYKAGLKTNDVIIAINDTTITDGKDALKLISNNKPGSVLHLLVIRESKQQKIKVTTAERPALP